jgi:hypothetical protein
VLGKILPHIPEGLTMLFEAPQREGKTLSDVIWGLNYFQEGRKIFSNIQLGFPHEPLEFGEMRLEDGSSKYRNGYILIDELNFFLKARGHATELNQKALPFLLQQKKQGCIFTGTTHNLLDLDVVLREHFDFLVKPEVWPKFPLPPQILRMIITNGPLQKRFYKKITLDCRPFLGLYDSFAVYDPFKNTKQPEKAERPRVKL